jgi:drug/metabolite transporter (DMT)-like permease
MLLTVTVWAVNFSVVKATLEHIPPLAFNTIRLIGSCAIMLALARFGATTSMTRGDQWRILLLGLVGHTFYQFLFILGINETSASNSALLLGLTPVAVAVIGYVLRVERVSGGSWAGILISFVGVYLVLGSSNNSNESVFGDLLVLAATLCWSAYTVLSKSLIDRHGPLLVTAYTMTVGTVFFVPFGIPSLLRLPWSQIPWTAWLGTIYSFAIALAAAYLIWYYAVGRVGPTRTAVYVNLMPAMALLVSWLALGEHLESKQLAGAGVILLGIYLVRRSRVSMRKN